MGHKIDRCIKDVSHAHNVKGFILNQNWNGTFDQYGYQPTSNFQASRIFSLFSVGGGSGREKKSLDPLAMRFKSDWSILN